MADQCTDTLRCNPNELRQAMSIHTRKITDSCRDKDCIEDLPVYLTAGSQRALPHPGRYHHRRQPPGNTLRPGRLYQAGRPLR